MDRVMIVGIVCTTMAVCAVLWFWYSIARLRGPEERLEDIIGTAGPTWQINVPDRLYDRLEKASRTLADALSSQGGGSNEDWRHALCELQCVLAEIDERREG